MIEAIMAQPHAYLFLFSLLLVVVLLTPDSFVAPISLIQARETVLIWRF